MGDMDLPASVRLTSEDVDAVFVDRLQYLARGIPDRQRPEQPDSGQIAVNDELLHMGFVVAEGLTFRCTFSRMTAPNLHLCSELETQATATARFRRAAGDH